VSRREFHVSADARVRYRLNETLFELSGNVVLANLRAVRSLAAEMTARRRADGLADAVVSPGELNALGSTTTVDIYRHLARRPGDGDRRGYLHQRAVRHHKRAPVDYEPALYL